MTDLLSERITELEIKLAHQELTTEQLNQTVVQQQSEIQRLNEYLKVINGKLNNLEEHVGDKKQSESPPPHY